MVQEEVEKKLTGQTTDNSGGVTLESFHKNWMNLK
jgi:Ca2+-binding EF-hand superfamily protein